MTSEVEERPRLVTAGYRGEGRSPRGSPLNLPLHAAFFIVQMPLSVMLRQIIVTNLNYYNY